MGLVHKDDTTIIITKEGQSIRFKESDIREMGRAAGGVRAIDIDKNDRVVGAHMIEKGEEVGTLLVISANGYGKRTELSEYKVQKRGGSGILTSKVTAKTGSVMSSQIVVSDDWEVVAISKKSQVVRVGVSEIPVLSRSTQGVRIMKLREGDSLASLICL